MKPPYVVPTMAEVRAVPWNGLVAASTFSGGGGSSLGYRMAGFRVAWASEFVEAARDTYRANFPDTILDSRDVREVTASDVMTAVGVREGELDLFDGSPPCASFSTAGSRDKHWGKVKAYSDTAQRTDDLFFEYARLVRGIRPKVFVAENVSGLVKGVAKGYFKEILAELKGCGYRVSARVLDARWLGVPQSRQRVIFVGVREDLGIAPVHPTPLPYQYTVKDALPHLRGISTGRKLVDGGSDAPTVQTHGIEHTESEMMAVEEDALIERFAIGPEYDRLQQGQTSDRYFSFSRAHEDRPSPCVTATGGSPGAAGVVHPTEKRKFTEIELKRICSFSDDYVLTGTYQQRWERCGRAVPPLMMRAVAEVVRDRILLPLRGRS